MSALLILIIAIAGAAVLLAGLAIYCAVCAQREHQELPPEWYRDASASPREEKKKP